MKFWKYCTSSIFALLLGGCSTSSLFTSYPQQMSANFAQINQGQFQQCIAQLSQAQKSNDYELYAAELGRVQQLNANFIASSASFMPLINHVETDQLAAKIRGSRVLATIGSLFVNDNLLPYQLSGYEIVLLYQYQTLNFITQGDIANALVTARKANEMQIYLANTYQQALAAAKTQAQNKQLNFDFINDQSAQLKDILAASASVKDSFANAMSYYLSGLLFLATNDLNDASVAFKQAVSIMPQNQYIQNMLLTTLQLQGAAKSTLINYQKAFGLQALPKINTGAAHITLMFEQNFVNPRIAITIPIYIPGLKQVQIFSFPAYPKDKLPITPLQASITANNQLKPLTATQLILNTNALAAKDLIQQYPLIFLRETLRVINKMSMVNQTQKKQNNGVNLADVVMQLYNNFSEQADLRSWLTLPADIQIGQYDLAPGTYHFHFSSAGLDASVSQELAANAYYLIWVTQYGKEIKARIFKMQ